MGCKIFAITHSYVVFRVAYSKGIWSFIFTKRYLLLIFVLN